MTDTELDSIGRVRSLAQWLRRTSQPAEKYPKRSAMTAAEIEAAKRFAAGMYPWPRRWTKRLYHLAMDG